MSSPAPLLRPPIPGSRSNSGTRAPRLGIAIPPSPSARAVNVETHQTEHAPPRPQPPRLNLATPMGSNTTPFEGRRAQRSVLPPLQLPIVSTAGSSDTSAASRSGSSGEHAAAPPSINLITRQLRDSQSGEQLSAVSSSHSAAGDADGLELPDLNKLSLDKGRPLDVDDLDEAGWRAASKENKIKQIGDLGEGSGGAVTRCTLEGGKTVFALKVTTLAPPTYRVQNVC